MKRAYLLDGAALRAAGLATAGRAGAALQDLEVVQLQRPGAGDHVVGLVRDRVDVRAAGLHTVRRGALVEGLAGRLFAEGLDPFDDQDEVILTEGKDRIDKVVPSALDAKVLFQAVGKEGKKRPVFEH